MKNSSIDLNNILFEQLERLNDKDLKGEKLKQEIIRSNAIGGVSVQIINNARLELDARKAVTLGQSKELPVFCQEKKELPMYRGEKQK